PADGRVTGGPSADFGAFRQSADAGQAAGRASSQDLRASDRLTKKAQFLFGQGDYAAAAEAADKALKLNELNGLALYTRALAYMNLKRYPLALKSIREALKLAPDNYQLLIAYANILNSMGRYEEALDAAGKALALNPDSAEALYNRAWALGGLGRRGDMVKALARAKALDGKFEALYEEALRLPVDADLAMLFTGGRGSDVRAASKAPAKREPGRARFWFLWAAGVLGLLLIALGLAHAAGGRLTGRIREAFGYGAGTAAKAAQEPAPAGDAAGGREGPGAESVIDATYQIVRRVGAGGMGVVYEGYDRKLKRKVAIKQMRSEISADARERARFIKEAETVAALHHPYIVDIYNIVGTLEGVYLIFEYIDGPTVEQALAERGRMDPAEALRVLEYVCSGLQYAHGSGIVHRDLKASNIMLCKGGYAKVMDFGIARHVKDAISRATRVGVGTPAFMAPEQALGAVGVRADIFALGACLYQMLTGEIPFKGPDFQAQKERRVYLRPSKIVAGLPEGVDGLIDRMLDPEPGKRPATAAGLVAELKKALS
ncbi:MAG: protein kinase, partial [Elusimicrobiota bacterium]